MTPPSSERCEACEKEGHECWEQPEDCLVHGAHHALLAAAEASLKDERARVEDLRDTIDRLSKDKAEAIRLLAGWRADCDFFGVYPLRSKTEAFLVRQKGSP